MDTAVQIYLQNQREIAHSEGFQSFHTLNFGEYQVKGREAFGNILAWNDEMLAPQYSQKITADQPTRIILLPLAGALEIDQGNEVKYVDSGECLSIVVTRGQSFVVTNPYPDQVVNYLQIRLLNTPKSRLDTVFSTFDLNEKDQLITVFKEAENCTQLVIGKYRGRGEGVYFCDKLPGNVLVFIIEGAFEAQNRLLERRDALSLKNVSEVEFEALSHDAIILIMQTAD